MEEKEMDKFSWTSLFFVTSFCFFMFSGFLKLLDGNHAGLFLKIGILVFIVALLSWTGQLISKSGSKSNRKLTS